MSPTVPLLMRQARLAALMWLTLLRRGSAAVPKAGGGGYAMAFDGLDGTTISLQWLSSPATQATVEYWIKLTDSHVSQQPLLAYSSYRVDGRDGLGGAPYENANELLAVHAPGFARFFRATISHDFQISAPYDLYERSRAGNWTHVAIVWSADPANGTFNAVTNATDQIAYYVNGELLTSTTACAYLACDMGMAIQPGGVLHLGQEADRPWGDFEELQALTAVVDELRVWNTVRTAAQIAANYRLGIDTASDPDASDLNLYWRFDTAGLVQGASAVDSGSKANDGLVGGMVTTENQLQYSTGRVSQRPTAPNQLPSTSGVVGMGPVVVAVTDGANTVSLNAFDADGDALTTTITSLPSSGALATTAGATLGSGDTVTDGSAAQSKDLIYNPTSYSGWTGDTFTYSVTDGTNTATGTVTLVRYSIPSPADRSYTFVEDELAYAVLAKPYITSVSKQTANLGVVVTSLPTRGTLYQACFTTAQSLYSSLCTAGSNTLVPITAIGTRLSDDRGVVMFQSAPNEFKLGSEYTNFKYKLVDIEDSALESAEATVTIQLDPVNDAPRSTALTVTSITPVIPVRELHYESPVLAPAIKLTLSAVDDDDDPSNAWTFMQSFAPHHFAKITTFPRAGTLHQTQPDGSLGALLDAGITSVPIVNA